MNLTKENIHEVYQNVLELVKLGKSTNSILASLGLERNKFIHLLNKEQKRELRDERVVFAHKYRVEQYWDGTLEEIGVGFGGFGGSTYTIPKLQPFEAPRDIRLKQDALAISWMGRPESKNGKEKLVILNRKKVRIKKKLTEQVILKKQQLAVKKEKLRISKVNRCLKDLYRELPKDVEFLSIEEKKFKNIMYGSNVMCLSIYKNIYLQLNKIDSTYVWAILYHEDFGTPIFIIQHNMGFNPHYYEKYFVKTDEFNRLDKNRNYIHVFGSDLILINQ